MWNFKNKPLQTHFDSSKFYLTDSLWVNMLIKNTVVLSEEIQPKDYSAI